MKTLLAAAAMLFISGVASAHGADAGIGDQLVKDGAKLVTGTFTAQQPGPLVVVPHVAQAPECAAAPTTAVVLPLGHDAEVAFFGTADGLHTLVDLPPATQGFVGMAVDTHDASRALILMDESAIALHGIVSVAWRDGAEPVTRTGALGVPYALPGEGGHAFNYTPEGRGILIDHDDSFRGGSTCAGNSPGHRAFSFTALAMPDSVGPGRIVHVVLLYDPDVPAFIPRPIDESTRILEANLYLARAGEDPVLVARALDPQLGLPEYAPLGLVLVGLAWAVRQS